MTPREVVEDLEWRYERAIASLGVLAEDASIESEKDRLNGKADGVRLALSYLRDYRPHFTEND